MRAKISRTTVVFAVCLALTSGLASRTALAEADQNDGCAAFLTPASLDKLRAQTIDPVAEFEAWRQANPNMMEVPPSVNCRHVAWAALHPELTGGNVVVEPEMEALVRPLAASVGANVVVASGVSTYQGEVQLSINPNNALQMVAGANTFFRDSGCVSPTGGIGSTYGTQTLYGSTDGGTTWRSKCSPWPASVTGGVSGADEWFGSDPAMAWDNAGNAYAVYMLISASSSSGAAGAAIVISKSTDSGTTWAALGVVVNRIAVSSSLDDKELVAIDRSVGGAHSHTNRIYVIWDEGNVERVAYSDNGTTWTTVNVDTGGDIGGNLTVAADGTVYAAWNRYSTGGGVSLGDQLYVKQSTDGGATWTAPHTNPIVPRFALASFGTNHKPPAQNVRGINAFPSIDVDTNPSSPFFGRVYINYCDYPSGTGSGTNLDSYLVTSSDGGATWTGPVKVNDDAGTASQFFPWMSVDQSDGTVNVSWYDTRVDATNNRKAQIYYARSTDGGATFEPNILVMDGGTNFANHINYCDENSTDDTAYNPNQYGDYAGMAAANRTARALWTDTRQFYTPTVNAKREDAAVSAIVNCSAPASPISPTVSCAAASSTLVSWSAPASWGTNATGGTYSVIRCSDAPCTVGRTVLSTNATSPYTDAIGVPGTYFYQVVATNNCPGTVLTPMSSASIASATATATNSGPICAGSTLNLFTQPVTGATYSWTGPNGFTSSSQSPSIPAATTAATGTYSVTITSGCGPATATTAVTVNAVPSTPTTASNGPVCAGAALNLSTPTVAGATYAWTGPNSFVSSSQNPTIASPTTAASGTYSVTVTVTGCTSSAGTTAVTVNPDTAAPTVTAPGAATIDQSTCCGTFGGATTATSAALSTFVSGGSATDDCAASPTHLTARIGAADVTSATCFPAGVTTVTFRFQDTAGKIGTATATATVRMFGDLNLDNTVDPSDMVILRAYFNFVVTPGTAPFLAPLGLADLNHDTAVDPSDLVILRSYFNFAVTCMAP